MARRKQPEAAGPSADEQAMADAEQREIIARMRAQQAQDEKAERANYAGKLERAALARLERKNWEAIVADLVKRVAALEANRG